MPQVEVSNQKREDVACQCKKCDSLKFKDPPDKEELTYPTQDDVYKCIELPEEDNMDYQTSKEDEEKCTTQQNENFKIIEYIWYLRKLISIFILCAVKKDLYMDFMKIEFENGVHCGVKLKFGDSVENNEYVYIIYSGNIEKMQEIPLVEKDNSRIKIILYPKNLTKEAKDSVMQIDEFLGMKYFIYPKSKNGLISGFFDNKEIDDKCLEEKTKMQLDDRSYYECDTEYAERESTKIENIDLILSDLTDDIFMKNDKISVTSKELLEKIKKKQYGMVKYKVTKPIENFIERPELSLELCNKLHENQQEMYISSRMVVISGTVGVGKTELAKKFVDDNCKQYHNIIWIDCSSVKTAEDAFRSLAMEELHILGTGTNGKQKEIKSLVDDVYHFFRNKRTLFIFDNAPDHTSVFLPISVNQCRPYGIITSQNKNWNDITLINVESFKESEAKSFIQDRDSDLAKEFEYNPWFLNKIKRISLGHGDILSKENHTSGHGEVTEDFTKYRLEKIFSKSISKAIRDRMTISKDDICVLDNTVEVLKKDQFGEKAISILKRLSNEGDMGINELTNLGENLDDVCSVISLLMENSLVAVCNKKMKIFPVVKFILFLKWSKEDLK